MEIMISMFVTLTTGATLHLRTFESSRVDDDVLNDKESTTCASWGL